MEATIVYWGFIGLMEKKMEANILVAPLLSWEEPQCDSAGSSFKRDLEPVLARTSGSLHNQSLPACSCVQFSPYHDS